MLKVAYICEPQVGGTFTFFRRLRPVLERHGIDFRCVSPISTGQFKGTRFEGTEGVDFIDLPEDLVAATRRLIEHIQQKQYGMIMVLPGADILSSNLPRYLPRSIRCVMRVPMMTRGAYAPARAVSPHLNWIYAVSDRISDDLVRQYHLPQDQIEVIYHGVDPAPLADALQCKSTAGPLRLLYAGRLWDIDKGIFLLPPILKILRKRGVDLHLTVAGSGQDGEELKRRFGKAVMLDQVTLAGTVPLEQMNDLYRKADVFVFPSRFEGCGFAVLEAMSAGCAPVVSNIRGSLRVIVDNGTCGALARVGDPQGFARPILEWAADRAALRRMQQAARQRVLDRFTLERMGADYSASFRKVLASDDRRAGLDLLDRYDVPNAFQPTWRTKIPRPVKNLLRTWLERMGRSS
jgi:glycosyltransferase involved in cell wall biosynthesis